MTFRSRLFLASLLASAVTLSVAALLVSWSVRRIVDDRIERALVNQARLAAETLSHRQAATPAELDAEAHAIGRLVSARVTFVSPDGTVVGDSELSADELATLENHGTRPEVIQARREGLGVARRYSATLKTDMLYVAVEVQNAAAPALSEVRLALPLTEIGEQLAAVRRSSIMAMSVGLLAALVVAWGASALLSRRVRSIAEMAERYASGDLSPPHTDYGTDEIGIVARALDDSMREIGSRVTQRETDRARMEAILNGMSEGVLVVTPQGRLQMVNNAARRMLKVEDAPEERHYLEIARHPDIAAEINGALHGLAGEGRELALAGDAAATFVARGRARGIGGRAWSRAGPARHHRPSEGGSHQARFRRQRLARAADTVDGRPGLRRGAARRRDAIPPTSGGSSKPSPGTPFEWNGSSAICCGWRGWMRARSRSTKSRAPLIRCSPR